jgi:acyl-CoA synthetase (AMP-forming)/AMP-acid ligase II
MPKGVMYTHGIFPIAIAGFGAAISGLTPPTNVDELLALGDQLAAPPVWLAACPQMHGTGMWLGTMAPLLLQGSVVTLTNRSFDAHELWQAVEREGVSAVVIVGDAFAKPMLRALDEKGYEAPSLKTIVSSGVMWSTEVKEGLLKHLDVTLYDGLGSTEGAMGTTISTRARVGTTAKFTTNPSVKVVTEDGREVQPGSDEIGMVAALSASLGYFKDPEKSARTFMVIDGVPHSLPGDWAKVAADGSLILLGRGSNCINTGGEKVFPRRSRRRSRRTRRCTTASSSGCPTSASASGSSPWRRCSRGVRGRGVDHRGRDRAHRSLQAAQERHHRRPRAAGSQRQGRLPVGERGREDRGRRGACVNDATTLPPPRSADDLDAADRDLDEVGVAVITGVLDPAATADVRARLLDAADRSDLVGIPTRATPSTSTRRTAACSCCSRGCGVRRADQASARASVREAHDRRLLISNFSANITGRCRRHVPAR